MTESDIMREIQMAMTQLGHRVFRNNIGSLPRPDGKLVKFGLCNPGGSDLIGISSSLTGGRFIAIEVKRPGLKATNDQQRFIDMILKFGGIAFVAHSAEEAIREICEQCNRF